MNRANRQNIVKKPWYKTKWAIAAHIALVYIGTSYYVHLIVTDEQRKRGILEPHDQKQDPSLTADDRERVRNEDIQNDKIQNRESLNSLEKTRLELWPEIQARMQRPTPTDDQSPMDATARSRFDMLAKIYDSKINFDERVIGLNLFRRRLLSHARGDILEVGVGTGRNLPYYPAADVIKSITFVDSSRPMLEQCIDKFEQYKHRFIPKRSWWDAWFKMSAESEPEINTMFVHVNACRLVDVADNSFDTVVDTFGICSVAPQKGPDPLHCQHSHSHNEKQEEEEDPVVFLNELARVCKPDGKVLLLEHGQGTYPFINLSLEKGQVRHFDQWKCWWNRDIEDIVRKSDLEIEYISRWHFGTTYYIIAKPKSLPII